MDECPEKRGYTDHARGIFLHYYFAGNLVCVDVLKVLGHVLMPAVWKPSAAQRAYLEREGLRT